MGPEEKERAYRANAKYEASVVKAYPLLFKEGVNIANAGVDIHDLTMIFADVTEPRYIDVCCHFDEEGRKMMAREIARAISASHERGEEGQTTAYGNDRGFVNPALPTRIGLSTTEIADGRFRLGGWVPSPRIVDEVAIYLGERKLDNVRFPTSRPDVWKNFPQYRTTYCGFVVNVPYSPDYDKAIVRIEIISVGEVIASRTYGAVETFK